MTKGCDTEPKQDDCLVRLKAPDWFKNDTWVLTDKFGREPISHERTVDVSRQHADALLKAGWHEVGPTLELEVQPYMIEPMTRPGGAGYAPLSSALLWIMTKGEPETKSLTNAEAWQAAVDLLLPLIRTGEVEIVGRPEGISRQMFAGAAVSGPLDDCARPGCERWIWSMPYVDPQMWDEGGFNDQLYLSVSESAAFTHLEVRKSDILREFVFPNLGCPSNGAGPGTKEKYDWVEGKQYAAKIFDERGDFESELNRVHGWKSQADLVRLVQAHLKENDARARGVKEGNEPGVSTTKGYLAKWLAEWRGQQ